MTVTDKQNQIEQLFDSLKKREQIETLSNLYWGMTDMQKDDFLREIE